MAKIEKCWCLGHKKKKKPCLMGGRNFKVGSVSWDIFSLISFFFPSGKNDSLEKHKKLQKIVHCCCFYLFFLKYFKLFKKKNTNFQSNFLGFWPKNGWFHMIENKNKNKNLKWKIWVGWASKTGFCFVFVFLFVCLFVVLGNIDKPYGCKSAVYNLQLLCLLLIVT